MATYELVITHVGHLVETIRVIRRNSELSISEIKSHIEKGAPVISIDSFDGPVDLFGKDLIAHQHRALIDALNVLRECGNEVQVYYWVANRDHSQSVDDSVLANLMNSELTSIDQFHD